MRFLFFSLLLLVSSTSYGQNQSVLKTDLLRPIRGTFGVAYEHGLGKVFSAQLLYEWGVFGQGDDFNNGKYKVTGYGIIPEIRYYPFQGEKHWMVQPFVGTAYRYLRFYEAYETLPGFAYMNQGTLQNIGLLAGGRLTYKKLCVELLAGFGQTLSTKFEYNENSIYIPSNLTDGAFLKYEEKFSRIELSVGYFFGKAQTSL